MVIGLSLGGTTGYAINPARDLGPAHRARLLPIPGKGDSDWGYSWVPVVGPIVGGVRRVVYGAVWVNRWRCRRHYLIVDRILAAVAPVPGGEHLHGESR